MSFFKDYWQNRSISSKDTWKHMHIPAVAWISCIGWNFHLATHGMQPQVPEDAWRVFPSLVNHTFLARNHLSFSFFHLWLYLAFSGSIGHGLWITPSYSPSFMYPKWNRGHEEIYHSFIIFYLCEVETII